MKHDNSEYVSTGNYEQPLYTVMEWSCGCRQRFDTTDGYWKLVDETLCQQWVNESECLRAQERSKERNINTHKGVQIVNGTSSEIWFASTVHYELESVSGKTELEAVQKLKEVLAKHHRRLSGKLMKVDSSERDVTYRLNELLNEPQQ